ncbi:MAG: hypothetical protein OXE85_10980, partial [Roseovarius sp.]|nr:hypothetical protein [Roseovarius sp.]
MKTLVTGATGFIGACPIKELLAQDHSVAAADLVPEPCVGSGRLPRSFIAVLIFCGLMRSASSSLTRARQRDPSCRAAAPPERAGVAGVVVFNVSLDRRDAGVQRVKDRVL